jgi:hypothetical protein
MDNTRLLTEDTSTPSGSPAAVVMLANLVMVAIGFVIYFLAR